MNTIIINFEINQTYLFFYPLKNKIEVYFYNKKIRLVLPDIVLEIPMLIMVITMIEMMIIIMSFEIIYSIT